MGSNISPKIMKTWGFTHLRFPARLWKRRLKWETVRPLVEKYLGAVSDLEVFVYETSAAAVQSPSVTKHRSTDTTSSGDAAQRI